MFYSRPKIAPLGWDLASLPVPNGSRHFDGHTTDGRYVDFRFSGGWISVERGPVGAPPDTDMEEVLSECISPFGTMDISAEQICDILGLTVLGQKIYSGDAVGSRGFDWSGKKTYWESTHLMLDGADARAFVSTLLRALPGSVLIQPWWDGSAVRVNCRQIKFLMKTDDVAIIGIGYDRSRLEKMLEAEEVATSELESIFDYSIEFSRRDSDHDDITLGRYIKERGADKLGLKYDTVHHRSYRIRTEYATVSDAAQFYTWKLLSNLQSYFCSGLEVIDLQTKAKLGGFLRDDGDAKSCSKALRERCLEQPNKFLYVSPGSMAQELVPVGDAAFVGYRPMERMIPFQIRR